MIDRIIAYSIKNKLVIALLMLGLIAWGTVSLMNLPIDAVPDITNNQAQIITSSPSLAAQDIERLVTFPIEQTMATIPGIEEMRSFSRFGLSVVTVVFNDDIDIYWAREQINQRLTLARQQIPAAAGIPEMAPVTTGLGEIFQYTIQPQKGFEDKYDATELRTIQDWVVRRQLLGVEGVADVSSFGGLLKQYEIAIDPDKLRSANITIDEVFAALERNNQNTGGAYIDKNPNAWFIRSEGLVGTMADIEKVVIKNTPGGQPILIRNVANVQMGHAVRYGALTRNDEGEAVGAVVLMLKGANSSKVIDRVKERIAQIEKTLPDGLKIVAYLDRTKLVDNAIGTVTKNLAEGALIVIFVLVLLLGNLRAGLIVASVIPLAMLFAVGMMQLFGVSGNLMSLGAIDFGLIVDGAVIIVEATMHHLGVRNLQRKLTQAEMDDEVYHSAKKIRNAAAFGEIIILIVYLPILALVGIEGKMFGPMAQTVSFAILGAFILSLTYVPMISALFLSKNVSNKRTFSDKLMDFFQRLYSPAIKFALKRKALVITSSVVALAGALILFINMGGEFIPSLDEGDFSVETRVLTGSSLSHTIEISQKAAGILKAKFPEVKEVIGKIGSSEIPTDPMPIEACDMIVVLKDRDEWTSAETRDELAEKMAKELEAIPGVSFGFLQPIQMRFNELMTGARQDVVIKIYGEDLDKLTEYAEKTGKLVAQVQGAQDIYVEKATGLQQMVVNIDREALARYGLDIETVNRALRVGFAGEAAGQVFEGERRFDMVVRLDKNNRQNIEDLKGLYVPAPNGQNVPLEQIADIDFVSGPNQIQRDDAKRRIVIGFNVRGRDVQSIVEEVKAKMETQVKFSPGYYATYGGTFKNFEEARNRLAIAVPVALLLIFVLLYFTFHSIGQSLLIFTAIPFSAIGGVLALWLRDMPFSISAGVGFIALFGVAVLNGIVLIGEFNRLKKEGYTQLNRIILKGTAVRLRPVIMTALVASLGFLPMALSNSSGAEVQKPLATVVIGGLITATLLTLLVLPVLYSLFTKSSFTKKLPVTPAITCLALALIPFTGAAQTPLTLETAINTALQNNYGIQASKQEVTHRQLLKKTSSDIGKTNINVMLGQYNSIQTDNNITISQTLPFPTVLGKRAQLATETVKSSQLQLSANENSLVKAVKQTWHEIVYLLANEKLLVEQDSLYKGFVQTASARYAAGETNLLEKTTALARQGLATDALQQHRALLNSKYTYLQLLLNTPDSLQFPAVSFEAKTGSTLADSNQLHKNPLLQWWQQQQVIAYKQKQVEGALLLPDITIGYFSQTLIGTQTIGGNSVFYGSEKRFTGMQVGISIPLWFAPQTAKVRAAETQQLISQTQYKQAELELNTGYKQAVLEFTKSKTSLDYYTNTALPNAQLIMEQAQKAWKSGEIGYVEYLQSLSAAIEIKQNHLQALNNYNQAVIEIEYLLGIK
ncbi:MAG: CusA/CzcA family heavy metal efflux RND transporter [Bacteroidetes bacterium]|nr:MAG: CusA/CzcA family heavy metal efflux RND transporter [Bacteroidota bacterium]